VELHRGRWRVRATVPDDAGTPRKRTLETYDDELAAQRMARAWNARSEGGAHVPTRFGQWVSDWLDRRELEGSARGAVRGVDAERSVARRHVLPSPLADLSVQTITRADVEDFAIWLRRRPKVSAVATRSGALLRETGETISTQTQRHALRLVRGALAAAVGRLIDVNPAAEVEVARGRKVDLSDDWLRADEIDRLLSCPSMSAAERAVYAVAIGTGLRLGDLKALRVADLDLDVQVPGPGIRLVIEKNEQPHRVPVLPWLLPVLRAHLATLPVGAVYVFPTRSGGRYCEDYDFRWAEKRDGKRFTACALERAGIERRIRFHDLRGTTATHLALGTWGRAWTLTEVQHFLKHSEQSVTERYVRRAHDVLAAAARGTLGGPGCPPFAPHDPANRPRTQQDSNLRPSAPEADALSS
jgi:integrase